MLDKVVEVEAEDDVEVPAIGIEVTSTIGNSRQLTLRTGVKLTATPERINAILDKVVDASDRQKYRHDLMATKQLLANAEQDLYNNQMHKSDFEAKCLAQWASSAKRGEWKPQGSQGQQIANLQSNIDSVKTMIETHKKRIVELEKKCL